MLAAGHDVRFVMRPISRARRHEAFLEQELPEERGGPEGDLATRDPFVLAHARGLPCHWVGDASAPPVLDLIARAEVDVLVVAFFNQLLKPEVFGPLRHGALNAHPSLLPRYRGPAPLFWTFRDGVKETGVTIHAIAPGEDDGGVYVQERASVATGESGEALVERLAALASEGIVTTLGRLERGEAELRPQDASQATRAPRPEPKDLEVRGDRSASHVYSFVRGVAAWNALWFDAGGRRLRVMAAVAFDDDGDIPGDYVWHKDTLRLRCDPGVVTLRVFASTAPVKR
jgi:methionyl-tRNA formyltransferase